MYFASSVTNSVGTAVEWLILSLMSKSVDILVLLILVRPNSNEVHLLKSSVSGTGYRVVEYYGYKSFAND